MLQERRVDVLRRLAVATFVLALVMASCASRPWTFTVVPGDRPMILRIDDGDGDMQFLIPDSTVPNADGGIVLDVPPRAAGTIELIDPQTCEPVAQADIPQTGPGVLVTYWQTYRNGETDLVWELDAGIDTKLENPTAPISVTAQCRVPA